MWRQRVFQSHAQERQQGRQIGAVDVVVAAAASFTTVLNTGPAYNNYTTLPFLGGGQHVFGRNHLPGYLRRR